MWCRKVVAKRARRVRAAMVMSYTHSACRVSLPKTYRDWRIGFVDRETSWTYEDKGPRHGVGVINEPPGEVTHDTQHDGRGEELRGA